MTDVTVFTTSVCPYCHAAKRLLTDLGVEFEEIVLDERPELRRRLLDQHNWRTVPAVFVGDELIGGFNELKRLDDEGALSRLLS